MFRVIKTNSLEAGGCTFCLRGKIVLYSLQGKTLTVHLCSSCCDEMLETLREQEAPRPVAAAEIKKEEPDFSVLERARKLQALAIDKAATEGERRNAWDQFEKLWKRYNLPTNIGM